MYQRIYPSLLDLQWPILSSGCLFLSMGQHNPISNLHSQLLSWVCCSTTMRWRMLGVDQFRLAYNVMCCICWRQWIRWQTTARGHTCKDDLVVDDLLDCDRRGRSITGDRCRADSAFLNRCTDDKPSRSPLILFRNIWARSAACARCASFS